LDFKKQEYYRKIPGIDRLLEQEALKPCIVRYGKKVTADGARAVTGRLRYLLEQGEVPEEAFAMETLTGEILCEVHKNAALHLKKVINGSGVLLHTNLGRAPICRVHLENVCKEMDGYTSLEMDLSDGSRGWREGALEDLICRVTGAEAALVVNNNAAAVLLSLAALSRGKEVLVSRGELIEIGGKFRIPDVVEQSGCILKEVGCTNRTRLSDYERAVSCKTGALLKVHTSNYRMTGFTESTPVTELSEISRRLDIPLIEDLGSGVLVDISPYGLDEEPTVQDALRQGADVIAFSGDKLLGGPQAGILLGRKKYIQKMAEHPLMRALRPDKFLLALLEQTFLEYQDPVRAFSRIPILKMIQLPSDILKKRAESLRTALLEENLQAEIFVMSSNCAVGGGALPGKTLESYALAVRSGIFSASALKERLLAGDTPVLSRIQEETLLVDLRAVQEEELPVLKKELSRALQEDDVQ
jgi:L-seryl-tRNA(Sec) selenium transferase